jgi:hypothetical protein
VIGRRIFTRTGPAPEPSPRREVTALEYYGAVRLPDLSGWWVYALGAKADGHIYRAGQSDNLISRLRDHSYTFKDLWDPEQVWLIRVRDQQQADVREAELIDFYQPETCTAGRRAELEKRMRGTVRGGFYPGHTYNGTSSARSLDSGQASV